MSKINYQKIVIVFLIILASACQANAPLATPIIQSTPTPHPTPTLALSPTPSIISQWAVSAESNIDPDYSSPGSSNMVIGETRNSTKCNEVTVDLYSWLSDGDNSWLEVYFDVAVNPTQINIFQSFTPSQVVKIEILDTQGLYHEIYSGNSKEEQCPYLMQVDVSGASYAAVGVRIWVNENLGKKAGIDAVQLVGTSTGQKAVVLQPTFAPPAPITDRSYADRPDDYEGQYQFHVIYVLLKDQDDVNRDTNGSIANSIKLANTWFEQQSGGSTLRFDTYQGQPDITFLSLDKTSKEVLESLRPLYEKEKKKDPSIVIEDFYFDWFDDQIRRLRISLPGKYYIMYLELEHPNLCGRSQFSNHLGLFFLQSSGCGYGRLGVDKYAWENEFVLIHELLHGIGFVPICAPHYTEDNPYHVNDTDKDLMYSYVGRGQSAILDYGNDDYFNHNIENCPDLADSVFLEPSPQNAVEPDWPFRFNLLYK